MDCKRGCSKLRTWPVWFRIRSFPSEHYRQVDFVFTVLFFETGCITRKPKSLTYWLQITQIRANAGYAASKVKRSEEDPSASGRRTREQRPHQCCGPLAGLPGASAHGRSLQKRDREPRLVCKATKIKVLSLSDQTEQAVCIAQIEFVFEVFLLSYA